MKKTIRILGTIRRPDKDKKGKVVSVIIEPYEVIPFKRVLQLAKDGVVFYVKNDLVIEYLMPVDTNGDGQPEGFISASGDKEILNRIPIVSRNLQSVVIG